MNVNHFAEHFLESVERFGGSCEIANAFFIAGVKLISSQNGTPEQLAALVAAHNQVTRGNN